MIVQITLHHPETKSKAWMTRRSREMMRKVVFALSVSPVLCPGDGEVQGVQFSVEAFMDACRCTIDFPSEWTMQQIDTFVRYIKDEKNVSVLLIPDHEPATLPT
jgi:hypothetical protein